MIRKIPVHSPPHQIPFHTYSNATTAAAITAPTLPATLPAAPVKAVGLGLAYVGIIGEPVPAAAPAPEPDPEPIPEPVPMGMAPLLTAVNMPPVEQGVELDMEGRVIILGAAVEVGQGAETGMVELLWVLV